MNAKVISLILGWASALGISYLAFDALTSLGDWGYVWSTTPMVLIVALLVAVPAVCLSWLGIILIEQAKNNRSIITRVLLVIIPSWIWLYVGWIIVGIMRLQ